VKNCFEVSFNEERLGTLNYMIGALDFPHEPLSVFGKQRALEMQMRENNDSMCLMDSHTVKLLSINSLVISCRIIYSPH